MASAPTMSCQPLDEYGPVRVAAFRLYLHWFVWRKFSAVRLSRTGAAPHPAGVPVVIYCNHPSWWDPALFLLALPWILPGRRGFAPMDAAELRRYALFRRMGVFGIELGTRRGAAAFLRTALAILNRPGTCLCVTAEGAFTDPRLRPVRLRPGLAHLARLRPDAVFLPLALEYSFWNESTPEALMRFGPAVRLAQGDGVAAWQIALEDGLTRTMDALAAESAQRDPALFTRLLGGTAGVGGIYDAWRRLRAAFGGPAFQARHQAEQR